MIRRSSTNEHWLAWADLVDKASSYHLKPASVFLVKNDRQKWGNPIFGLMKVTRQICQYDAWNSFHNYRPQKYVSFRVAYALSYLFASLCELEWNVAVVFGHITPLFTYPDSSVWRWSLGLARPKECRCSECLYVFRARSSVWPNFESTDSGLSPGSYEPLTTRVHEQAPNMLSIEILMR